MTSIFSRKVRGRFSQRDTERSSCMTMKTEIGVTLLQAKEQRGPPDVRKTHGTASLAEPLEG